VTILNDKEIRKECLVPTHSYGSNNGLKLYYSLIEDKLYSLDNGHEFPTSLVDGTPLTLMTEDEVKEWVANNPRMISPFNEKLSEKGVISYGLSSFGYDATLARKVKIAKSRLQLEDDFFHEFVKDNPEPITDQSTMEQYNEWIAKWRAALEKVREEGRFVLDPKNPNPDFFYEVEDDSFVLPPHGFALGYTNEYFNIPKDVLSLCLGKSTYARSAIHVLVTPLEPGWAGNLVVEITNNCDIPVRVYTGEGIAQFIFHRGNPCEVSYSDRGGKYQGQTGITMGKILTED
jgi:deoxycytidine triphosphate deaminase